MQFSLLCQIIAELAAYQRCLTSYSDDLAVEIQLIELCLTMLYKIIILWTC